MPTVISKVWVDSTHVYAETTDGRRASYAFEKWPRLANAPIYLVECSSVVQN